jgi:A/G-specific adenine glycosylase
VLTLWSGLGYYRRAHHLHAAAKAVVGQHGGRFPADAAALVRLPGVGRSTAAAMAAFASDEQGAILDGNVKRVLARHEGIEGWPGEARVQAALWRAAESFADDAAGDIAPYAQGLMDVGATICTRKRPRCNACPVAGDCIARRDGRIDALPAPRPRKELPRRSVTLLLLQRGGDILLERRPPTGVWSGLWSLPEVPCTGDPVDHVAARFTAGVDVSRRLPALTHAFTHFVLTMQPVAMTVTEWPSTVNAGGFAWFTRDAAIAAALPSPIRKLLRAYA